MSNPSVDRTFVDNIEILFEAGVDVNAKDSVKGITALHIAVCLVRSENILKLLFKHKDLDLNAQDNDGNTPLHSVAIDPFPTPTSAMQKADIVTMLWAQGANILAINGAGETPLDCAANNEKVKNVLNALIEKANVAADTVIGHINGETLSVGELSKFQEVNQRQHDLLVAKIKEKNTQINAPQAINTLNHYMEENWLERLGISKAIEGTKTAAKKGVPWKEGEPSLVTLPQDVL